MNRTLPLLPVLLVVFRKAYPACPKKRELRIAEHVKYSGRV